MRYMVIIILLFAFLTVGNSVMKIPLTYVVSKNQSIKYPIQLSFNSSQTFSPQPSNTLSLFNLEVPLNIYQSHQKQSVVIGLKYPSDFLYGISSILKVNLDEIQFGKDEYLQLIIKDRSFVQSQDLFIDNSLYTIRVTYNYGPQTLIQNELCKLIDSQLIYFNQFFIRQLLLGMSSRNQIQYKFDEKENTIALSGNLQNFPKITLMKNNYLFNLKITMDNNKIHYLPVNGNSGQVPNLIGIHSLYQFGKFQVLQQTLIFKRTSLMYMIYVFLGYFFIFCLGMILFCRNNLFATMKFVRSILKWAIMKDPQARIQVLRTQLQ